MRGLSRVEWGRAFIIWTLIWSSSAFGQQTNLNPGVPPKGGGAMREFVTACTYGVLAGTMVGTATLAFENKPGDSLQNVARGASIGLYAGILLGLYVVYIVPGQIEREKLQMYEDQGLPPPETQRLTIFPLIAKTGIDGIATQYRVLDF